MNLYKIKSIPPPTPPPFVFKFGDIWPNTRASIGSIGNLCAVGSWLPISSQYCRQRLWSHVPKFKDDGWRMLSTPYRFITLYDSHHWQSAEVWGPQTWASYAGSGWWPPQTLDQTLQKTTRPNKNDTGIFYFQQCCESMHWIWIRILNVRPIWTQIHDYVINFQENKLKIVLEE